MLADLHVHSIASVDGNYTVRQLALEAKKAGIDAIGVCDHNNRSKEKPDVKGVLVLIGEEVSTAQGHVAVFGVKKVFRKGIQARELLEKVHGENGVCIAVHPFSLLRPCLGKKAFELPFDAVEKYNGRSFWNNARNALAGFKGTGGSDAHFLFELGSALTRLECEPKEKDVLERIRKKKFTALWRPHPLSFLKRAWRKAFP